MLFCIFVYFDERNTNAVLTASFKFNAPKYFAWLKKFASSLRLLWDGVGQYKAHNADASISQIARLSVLSKVRPQSVNNSQYRASISITSANQILEIYAWTEMTSQSVNRKQY